MAARVGATAALVVDVVVAVRGAPTPLRSIASATAAAGASGGVNRYPEPARRSGGSGGGRRLGSLRRQPAAARTAPGPARAVRPRTARYEQQRAVERGPAGARGDASRPDGPGSARTRGQARTGGRRVRRRSPRPSRAPRAAARPRRPLPSRPSRLRRSPTRRRRPSRRRPAARRPSRSPPGPSQSRLRPTPRPRRSAPPAARRPTRRQPSRPARRRPHRRPRRRRSERRGARRPRPSPPRADAPAEVPRSSWTPSRTVGQPAATAVVRAMLATHVPHAVLLVGPASVGKEPLAMDLAAALLCTGAVGTDRPCRTCRGCRMVEHGNHPDLHRLEPEGAGAQIRIGDRHHPEPGSVRGLAVELALLPVEGGARVAIVRDAQRMNDDAQSALLKTLEEPPAGHDADPVRRRRGAAAAHRPLALRPDPARSGRRARDRAAARRARARGPADRCPARAPRRGPCRPRRLVRHGAGGRGDPRGDRAHPARPGAGGTRGASPVRAGADRAGRESRHSRRPEGGSADGQSDATRPGIGEDERRVCRDRHHGRAGDACRRGGRRRRHGRGRAGTQGVGRRPTPRARCPARRVARTRP